jgi:hypothetical protein|tara:strand:- start:292 stop:501 length:210 start_codon:yes stop_codon:yes gene_type:complete
MIAPRPFTIIYGKTRDTMTDDLTFETLARAKVAYYAMTMNNYCALTRGGYTLMSNVNEGPVSANLGEMK